MEIVNKALTSREDEGLLDILASAHAALGNYKDAVKYAEKGLAILKLEAKRRFYIQKINTWKQLMKK